MSSRKYVWNAWEQALNGAITAGATTITLDSVTNLRSPGLLVIDPDDPTKREYILFTGISSNDLTGVTRNLAGGVTSAHDDGARIRSVPMHQLFDDIFTDVEALEAFDTSHLAANNPHSNSAAADDLVATDANVAANAANIGTNLTSINANTADLIAHKAAANDHADATPGTAGWMPGADKTKLDTYPAVYPADIEDAYITYTTNKDAGGALLAGVGVWATVLTVGPVTVPTDWNTYDVVLRGGGVCDTQDTSVITDAISWRLRADIAGDTIMGKELDQVNRGAQMRTHVFMEGDSEAVIPPISQASVPTVSGYVQCAKTGTGAGTYRALDVSLALELRRRS